MPYLVVYLLYYMTKWQVNPTGKSQNPELQISNVYIPCMLHVYWALHAIHVVLAGFALWSWFVERRAAARLRATSEPGTNARSDPTPSAFPPLNVERSALSVKRSPLGASYSLPTTRYSLLTVLAPWALLALIFYIPGVYLEWPSDPWEHLRRINEWRILDTVGAHSSWMKSAYFIPYSLLSWCIGLRQLFWLDFYYTGICLLLCWQYYKLSRACGLGERASMVFVIIQALLFGNNIFSFYRYYGISSSIYAQLGAVALTRIVLQFAAKGTKLDPILQEEPKTPIPLTGENGESIRANPCYPWLKTSGNSSSLPLLSSVQTDNQADPFNAKDTKADLQTQRSQSKPSALRALRDLGVKVGFKPRPVSHEETRTPILFTGGNRENGDSIRANPCYPWLKKIRSLLAPLSPVETKPSNSVLHKETKLTKDSDPLPDSSLPSLSSLQTGQQNTGSENLTTDCTDKHGLENKHPETTAYALPTTRYSLLISVPALIALTALNHPQGLGIASLGIMAIIVWRLIEWKRSALWWMIGGTIIINALFLALYHRPAIIETYRAQGYLNAWYGFNILDLTSPAGERMLQIVSTFGLVNLAAAIFFLRRNYAIAWLTVTPLLALLVPCIAIPVATALTNHGDPINIITFQRIFFVFPVGLVLTACISNSSEWLLTHQNKTSTKTHTPSIYQTFLLISRQSLTLLTSLQSLLIICIALTTAVTIPAQGMYFNRTWNALYKVHDDLNLRAIWQAGATHSISLQGSKFDATAGLSFLQAAQTATEILCNGRVGSVPSNDLSWIRDTLAQHLKSNRIVLSAPRPITLTTPYSFAALGSTHWLPQETALAFSGSNELHALAISLGLTAIPPADAANIFFAPELTRVSEINPKSIH